MVAASISAPLGAPPIETGGRSKAPLIIAAAALGGFVIVGLLVMVMGRDQGGPQPPAAALPPAAPVQTVVVVQTAAPAPAPSAVPSPGAAVAKPEASAESTESAAPGTPRSTGKVRPGAKPAGPAPGVAPVRPGPAAKPPEPAPAPAGDVDLSNPYR
jgi:hypothetical protein